MFHSTDNVESKAPLSSAFHLRNAPRWISSLVALGAIGNTLSTVLACIVANPRILFRMAKDGLRPATEAERRCEIRPIYNTTQNMSEALTAIWATKTPAEAFATLAKPDVTVTNLSDKHQQLPKILTFDDRVREANRSAGKS